MTPWTVAHQAPCPWDFPKNTEIRSCSLLQGIFPTEGLNPSLWCCRRLLHLLSHQGSPVKCKGGAKASPCRDSPLSFLPNLRLVLGAELACVPGRTAGDLSLFMGFLRDKRTCWHWPLGFFFFKGEISPGSSSGLVAGHLAIWRRAGLTLLFASKLWTLGEWLCPWKPQFPSNRKTKVVTPTTQVWM